MTVDRQRLAELARQPHRKGTRFHNMRQLPRHGLREFIRWQRETGGRFPPALRFPLINPDPRVLYRPGPAPRLTWIGHASTLFQYRGYNILTDPVLSERCSPVEFAGPRRGTPPALTVDQLPDIHRVLISHNHYDHLDRDTVVALHRRFGDDLRFFVPSGLAGWFHRRGIRNLVELDWWQSDAGTDPETFCVPAQHFSGRGAFDGNRTLWCGWRLEFEDFSFYFAGDTGYGPIFEQMATVFGPVDLALIPIGAYAPRWFMWPMHVSPEDAVQIHLDIRSRQSAAIHWGTFVLTDEPLDEPPRRLEAELVQRGIPVEDFRVPAHGETLTLEVNE
jgi:N-acyl-phosphatidylethanolamine-hydrolysing phospholipase D